MCPCQGKYLFCKEIVFLPLADLYDSNICTYLTINRNRTMFVVKVPSTRLKMSEGGDYLAVGASDGSVTVVDVESFQTVHELILSLISGL
jgi:hypothetical protein